MFTAVQSGIHRSAIAATCSVAAHGLLLLWLLHQPTAKVVAPSFVVNGDHGTQIAHLYWPSQRTLLMNDTTPGTADPSDHQQLNAHLTWKQHSKTAKSARRDGPRPRLGTDAESSAPGQPAPARPAGSSSGTVLEGPLT